MPGLEFNGHQIVNSSDALKFKTIPKHLCVVGGGYIGLELGSVWLRLGAKVTVIEMLAKIATNLDGQIGRKLQRVLKRQGINFHMQSKVTSAKTLAKSVRVELQTKKGNQSLSCSRLLVSVGRKPLTRSLGLKEAGVKTDPDSGHITGRAQSLNMVVRCSPTHTRPKKTEEPAWARTFPPLAPRHPTGHTQVPGPPALKPI